MKKKIAVKTPEQILTIIDEKIAELEKQQKLNDFDFNTGLLERESYTDAKLYIGIKLSLLQQIRKEIVK